ncbi:hypothetical protein GCM10018954_028010 [Kutzneria kofuensis]
MLAATLLVTSFTVAAAPSASAAVCVWTRTALPTTGDRTAGDVTGGNDGGVLVGNTYKPNPIFAGSGPKYGAVWSGGKLVASAADPGTQFSGINNAGTVVGFTIDADGHSHAATFSSTTGAATPLPVDSSWINTTADAINTAGDIAGTADFGGSSHVVVWHAGGHKVLSQSSSRLDLVHGIDDQGRVLADIALPAADNELSGVVWDASGARHVLAGVDSQTWHTTFAIRGGLVAGSYDEAQAALWKVDGTLSSKIAGGTKAEAIGATGTVGGQAYDTAAQKYSTVLWKAGTVIATLPTNSITAGVVVVGPDDHTAAGSEYGRTWGGGPSDLPVTWHCM